MRSFIVPLLIVVLFCIFLLAVTIFRQNDAIKKYQKALHAMQYDYLKTKIEFDRYYKNAAAVLGNTIAKNSRIGDIIQKYTKGVSGNISIYYKNLATGESVIVDGERKYYMASLYKVLLTLYMLDEVKRGTLDLHDRIGTSSATIEQGLNKIITESNNEYAQSLGDSYGWKKIEEAMKQQLGIEFSFNKDLEINVKNVGLLFEEIAFSLKVSDLESSYLLQLLKDQKKIAKLPKYLPKHIYAHNKTGEFDDYSHDAGLFYTPKANYILIFLSKTKNPGETNEQMANMSKEIFDVLNDISNPQ